MEKAVLLAQRVIDFNAAPRDFLVNPDESPDLADLRSELEEVDHELQQIHDGMNCQWEQISNQHNQVRIEDVDSNSNTSCVWQFRLPNTNDIKLLQQHMDVKVHKILKNGVYFSVKELDQLGAKKKDVTEKYHETQRDLVEGAMAVASSFVPVLERASAILSELDVLASLAYVAGYSQNGYCRPEMTDGEEDGLGIEVIFYRMMPCFLFLHALTDLHHISKLRSLKVPDIHVWSSKKVSTLFPTISTLYLESLLFSW